MNDIQKRRFFQKVKSLSEDQFWAMMNAVHSQAYYLGLDHARTAMETHNRCYPKMIKEIFEKVEEIRETWDGLPTVSVEESILKVFGQALERKEPNAER
jgi:hypothetical protein